MKKLFAILMALAMIVALSTTAFAASTKLTVADGRTYTGHKLLDVTTSLKDGDTCENGHEPGCYNYAYTVNAAYRAVLAAQANVTTAGKTEQEIDQAIMTYLSDENIDMRTVADELYAKIVAAGIGGTTNLGNGSDIDQGYWLFVDTTSVDGENLARSLVLVNTKGQDALEITPKTGLPTVEKKVQDKNDTTGVVSAWQDSADHDIKDAVSFQLTATLPENFADYETYKIVFHDTLSAGLTLDSNSFTVTADGVDVKAKFAYEAGENGAFTYTCEDVTAIDGVTKDTEIVVTYTATLNEKAVVGAAGNTNEVYLEFSNDPYDPNATGETETDEAIVFTYKVVINKTDAEGNALNGAGFKLYKKNAEGTYVIIGDEVLSNTNQFVWEGLDDGDYKLEESTVPAGYNKMADIEFTISAEHDEESATPALISLNGGNLAGGVVETGAITKDIENHAGTILPSTGAKGTFMLIAGGSMLVVLAAVFMITRKKMSIYED